MRFECCQAQNRAACQKIVAASTLISSLGVKCRSDRALAIEQRVLVSTINSQLPTSFARPTPKSTPNSHVFRSTNSQSNSQFATSFTRPSLKATPNSQRLRSTNSQITFQIPTSDARPTLKATPSYWTRPQPANELSLFDARRTAQCVMLRRLGVG